MKPRAHLELLAPARDAAIGIEAVNHGADAVYIGGPAFGARDKAGNSLADIERLARHAHRYGARIFITLNTILRDDELEDARRMAWDVWRAGADALIVQDMGLLELDLPPIQLHASTQTDIRTPEKARFLQDVGFSQMVLARELDLRQVRAIAAEVQGATLEFFIHGALCVAYSGQCFISHAHTGRSANRGSCSQECRLPYTVHDAQGRIVAHDKHVLSLKDNDQSANLQALVDAGIAIGHIGRVGEADFEVELMEGLVLNNGDALTWWDRQGELQGVPVNVAKPLGSRAWRVFPNAPIPQLKDLRRDATISRNRDMAWERLLDRKSAERVIGVSLALSETPDGFRLDIEDADGHRAHATLAHPHEAAKDAARAEATLREHLAKLGGTLFEATQVTLALSRPWFLPASAVNTLRREAVAALEAAREAAFRRLPRGTAVEPPVRYPDDTLTYQANVYNGVAAAFYAKHGVKVIGAAYESHEELGEASLMITKHCVRWSLSLCPKQAKGVIGVQGTVKAEPLTLVNGNERLTLRFDCKPCEMHVVGKIRKSVLKETAAVPMQFYKTRPATPAKDQRRSTSA